MKAKWQNDKHLCGKCQVFKKNSNIYLVALLYPINKCVRGHAHN